MTENDTHYMQRCLELASMGEGMVSPNPLVGALLIREGELLGEGYHHRAGFSHAEIEAIQDAEAKNHSLEGATLYCNLEPCCHTKKRTPPCVDAIIAKKIRKVVIANIDPNPKVAGQGIDKLRAHGIEVEVGVLESEGAQLNEIFFHTIVHKRPFVHLKVAQTLDGKMATSRGHSKWITNESARTEVHRLRLKYDAVAVGGTTALNDNPELSIRMGIDSKGKMPWRLVFANPGLMNVNLKLFSDSYRDRTILICNEKYRDIDLAGMTLLTAAERKSPLFADEVDLTSVLSKLYEKGIHSILVEGGGHLLSSFIDQDLYDRMSLYIAPKIVGNGTGFYVNQNIQTMEEAINVDTAQIRNLEGQIVWEAKKVRES